MNSTPVQPIRRIVVVHGDPGKNLAEILHSAGLEVVVEGNDVTIWAPQPQIGPPAAGSDSLQVDIESPAGRIRLVHTPFRLDPTGTAPSVGQDSLAAPIATPTTGTAASAWKEQS